MTTKNKTFKDFTMENDIVTNDDHPNCYICNNGLCHLDITMKEVKEQW